MGTQVAWDSPGEWLVWKMSVDQRQSADWLYGTLFEIVNSGSIDNDTIQGLFQGEMETDGFFERLEDSGRMICPACGSNQVRKVDTIRDDGICVECIYFGRWSEFDTEMRRLH